MQHKISKIAFGGGCHWCTEAVFQSLKGVEKVEQGFVSSNGENEHFSEAVIVHFNSEDISLKILIEIHLHTHKSTSNHSMRTKYRSAVYTFLETQKVETKHIMRSLQKDFSNKIITQIIDFKSFKPSDEAYRNYYQKNPKKPFCETFINPKLRLLSSKFSKQVDSKKVIQSFE